MPRVLYGECKLTLAGCAGTCFFTGRDFSHGIYESAEHFGVFIIKHLRIIYTKLTLLHTKK